jgi:hypothetical protein
LVYSCWNPFALFFAFCLPCSLPLSTSLSSWLHVVLCSLTHLHFAILLGAWWCHHWIFDNL